MEPIKWEYAVQSPFTDSKMGRNYPLTKVVLEELEVPVVTKSMQIGCATQVTIYFHNGKVLVGQAVYTPEEGVSYSFRHGVKLAMQRALNKMPDMSRQMRRSIWHGCLWSLDIIEKAIVDKIEDEAIRIIGQALVAAGKAAEQKERERNE